MLLVAEHGVSSGAIVDFALAATTRAIRWSRRSTAPPPLYVDVAAAGAPPATPLEDAAVSRRFRCASEATRDGRTACCCVSGVGRRVASRDAVAAAGCSARSSSQLLGRQLLAETRFGQERTLLYSIINAVTDPILLTDTEGRLIIANARAREAVHRVGGRERRAARAPSR